MNAFLQALMPLQPVPQGWEALFATALLLSLVFAIVGYVKFGTTLERRILWAAGLAALASGWLAIANARYLHTFEPIPGENETQRVLPGPLWKCQALEEYRGALDRFQAIGPDEWDQKVYSASCKSSTLSAGVLVLASFTLATTLIFLVLILVAARIGKRGKPLLKALSAIRKVFGGA